MLPDRFRRFVSKHGIAFQLMTILMAWVLFHLTAPSIGKSFPISLSILLVLVGYCTEDTQRHRPSNRKNVAHSFIFLATLCCASVLGIFAVTFDTAVFYPQIISLFTLILLTTLPVLIAACSLLVGVHLSHLHSARFVFPLAPKNKSVLSLPVNYAHAIVYSLGITAALVLLQAITSHFPESSPAALELEAALCLIAPLPFGNAGVTISVRDLLSKSTPASTWHVNISPVDTAITALGIAALILLTELAKTQAGLTPSSVSEKEPSSDPQTREQLAKALSASGLSRRESGVLAMRVEKIPYDAIAAEFGISSSTARTYLHRALKKIGCSSVSEIVRKFLPGLDETTSQPPSAPNKVGGAATQGGLHAGFSAVISLAAGIYMVAGSIANEQKLAIFLASMGPSSNVWLALVPLIAQIVLMLGVFAYIRLDNQKESSNSCAANHRVLPQSTSDRTRMALLQLGLTPLYADIMLDAINGYTVRQICEHLHVARGTVKEAKSKSYSLLNAHSIREFRASLEAIPDRH